MESIYNLIEERKKEIDALRIVQDHLSREVKNLKTQLLEALDFFKVVVEIKQEINEHMQLIHDLSEIIKTEQQERLIQKKLIDYLVQIIADHVFWEKGEDNRCRNFKAKIEEIKHG